MSTVEEPSRDRRVLYVANTDWYLFNFRLNLIKEAERRGWIPYLACSDSGYTERLRSHKWPVKTLPLSTKGANPFREAWALYRLIRECRKVRPDVIHLFTLKCVLYGCLAAPFVPRARIVGALTGMGYLFTSQRATVRLLKNLVLIALKLGLKVSKAQLIFQNEFDRTEFIDNGLIPRERTRVIRGSGVDCEAFHPMNRKPSTNDKRRLLFCGRLIAEKGIRDYLQATATLREQGYKFDSRIAGKPYPGNPSSLSEQEVADLSVSTLHRYLGHQDDMPELLAATDIVVLPTYYREGTPKVLIEAAAAGCALITTTIPACEDIVENGSNGYYIKPSNPDQLAGALRKILDSSWETLYELQERSRQIAIERFSDTEINNRTLACYND
ncbi:group 1 glycosyl transferase [Salinisphaera sp. T5B8]|uniref:glycosyltransferase family 4 protein n=1 Tax=unclassified Salinisphaera TaxID=2649847 RepID=UPI00333F6C43